LPVPKLHLGSEQTFQHFYTTCVYGLGATKIRRKTRGLGEPLP
jgi:hypothetical protein